MLNRSQPPSILTSIHSPRWQSQLQRKIELFDFETDVHWHLDLESAVKASESFHDAILIAELPGNFCDQPEETITLLANSCNNSQRVPIFILGNETHEGWTQILLDAGATETCFSALDVDGLWSRIERHLKKRSTVELSVEEAVAARLGSTPFAQ